MITICQTCKTIARRMSDLGFSRDMAETVVFRWDRLALLKHRYECEVFKSLDAYAVRRVVGRDVPSMTRAPDGADDVAPSRPTPSTSPEGSRSGSVWDASGA